MKKYNWITIQEAAAKFNTPETIIISAASNHRFPKKRSWQGTVPKGKERYMFRSIKSTGWRVFVREDAVKIWCETRNLYMRDKSIAYVTQMDVPKLNLVKGLSLETVTEMQKKNKRLRKIHDSYRTAP